jgi:hypothetical protein
LVAIQKGFVKMNDTRPYHVGSRTTSAVLQFALQVLPHPAGTVFTHGMPAGSMHLKGAGLIIGGTPCTVPLFQTAMERTALQTGCDVLIARHGTHPEVLDPVMWDVIIWSGNCVVPVNDLVLYAETDGSYWLVPSTQGPHIQMAPDGLHLLAEPPFISWHERCEGVCEAARRIIAATRGGRR